MTRIPSTYKFAISCLAIALFSFAPQGANAQKFAYIDSDYVIEINFSEQWDIIWKIKSCLIKLKV